MRSATMRKGLDRGASSPLPDEEGWMRRRTSAEQPLDSPSEKAPESPRNTRIHDSGAMRQKARA